MLLKVDDTFLNMDTGLLHSNVETLTNQDNYLNVLMCL